MSKSSYIGANVEVDSDTFTSFINKVNAIIADMSSAVVTAAPVAQANSTNGASTTGNAHIQGVLSANVVVAAELRGGTMSTPATMVVSTNTNPKANTVINLGADASRFSNVFVINTNTRDLFANTATVISGNVVTLTSNLANLATGNVENLIANNATIATGNANNLTVTLATIATGNVNALTANVATVATGNVNALTANVATIKTGNVNALTSNVATMTTGNVNSLTANVATIKTGNVNALTANVATIATGNVNALTANTANINELTVINTINAKTLTTSQDVVVTGNLIVQGVTSLSSNNALAVNTSIAQTLTVHQQSNLHGSTFVGNTATDTLTIVARVDSNIIPAGNTYTLGNTTNRFTSAYIGSLLGNMTVGASASETLTINSRITGNIIPTSNSYTLGNTSNRYSKAWLNEVTVGTIDSNVIPKTDGTYTLGNTTNRFATAYFDTAVIPTMNSPVFTSVMNQTGTAPHYQLEETDTNTVGRMIVSAGELYIQAGAANTGANTSSGVLRFAGLNNADVGTFAVRSGGNWQAIYHQGNDGAGSGMDADLLDGQDGAYYLNATNFNAGTLADARLPTTMAGKTFTSDIHVNNADVTIDHTVSADLRFELNNVLAGRLYRDVSGGLVMRRYNETTGAAEAYIQITGNGVNDFKYNGFSIWHTGNDGASSGLDADLLDGQDGAYYRSATNINAGTLADARLPSSMSAKTIDGLTVTDIATFYTQNYATGGDILRLIPSDFGANKPGMYIKKIPATAEYVITFFDGTDGGGGFLNINSEDTASGLRLNGNKVWHAGNDGSSSGLDADLLDGYHASDLFRDNADFTSTGNMTLSNASPYIRLQDTTSGTYDARIRLDANNIYFDGSADGTTYSEVMRFEMDTKAGYMTSLFLSSGGEALRLAAPTAGQDPYISWYSGATRTGYIQYSDSGTHTGFFITNDVSDDKLGIDNSGGTSALRFWDNSRSALDVVLTSANYGTYDTNIVSGGMAGLSVGTVGTYALLIRTTEGTADTPGATVSGSLVQYTNCNGNGSGVSPPGTWRCMAYQNGGSEGRRVTIYMRIS